ncbi:MAG: protein kinase [Planctomycetota bacterium]
MRLRPGQIVQSPVSKRRYEVTGLLGQGGFGNAYRAWELNRRGRRFEEVCLKVTIDQSSWHRESYFGELLSRQKRVIQLLDTFPLPAKTRGGNMLFCLVLELAEQGTIADYLEKTGKPWPQERAVREIVALLRVLEELHGGSATHRDLTPMNIFVAGHARLKLGDFGIARHSLAGRPQTIDAFNPAFVTQGFRSQGAHRYWQAVDDVFQMGQLLAMLLRGEHEHLIAVRDVKKLDCDDELKRVLKKAIGPRRQRYQDAWELAQALLGAPDPKPVRIRSLRGKTVVFTGPLSIRRFDAEAMVRQVGGKVGRSVSRDTDVLVQGGRSAHERGHKGTKLLKAERLARKGIKIAILTEAQFRRLIRSAE